MFRQRWTSTRLVRLIVARAQEIACLTRILASAVLQTSTTESPAHKWRRVLARRFSGAPGPLHKARPTGVSPASRVSGYTLAECSALDIPGGAPIEAWLQSIPQSSPSPPAPSVHPPRGPSRSRSDIDSPKLVP